MSLSFDLYVSGNSWLYRLDARVKLLAVMCGSALVLSYRSFVAVLAALAVILAVMLSAGLRRSVVFATFRVLWPIMLMITLFTALLTPAGGLPLFEWWIVRCSTGSLVLGVTLALRIAVLALIIMAWLYTTNQSTITRSLVALGLPHPWGLTLAMALRFIPMMAANFRMIGEAQQARALELNKGSLLKKARAFIPITVAMIITSLRTAEALARALASRGFGLPRKRTTWHPLRMRPADWASLAVVLLVTGLGLAVRLALGWGG